MSSDETLWLTYRQAADKLGVSPQAVRQKAIRGRWPRTKGNDGQARVQVPEHSIVSGHRPARRPTFLSWTPSGPCWTLKGDVEKLEALLAAERERADKAIAAFEALARRLEAMAEARRPAWWRWLRFAD